MAGGQVTGAAVRNDPPEPDDFGLVTRPILTLPIVVVPQPAATSVVTTVGSVLVSTTLLAANPDRLGATIYNDSNSQLFVKLGAGASIASFTIRLETQGYYEVPARYVGVIDGIWTPVVSGAARVTELTP